MATATMDMVPTTEAGWDKSQVELIKRQLAPGIDDGNLKLFGMVCARAGLDPFLRQIYTIKRGDKWTIQTGIDGYRLMADRTGHYAGSDDAVYDREDGDQPNKATVTVYKMVGGMRCPFTATARWSEYAVYDSNKKLTSMWARMPWLMLAKCAEGLALRKAFPAELSGVYTGEEMAQADNDTAPHADVAAPVDSEPTITRADVAAYAMVHNIPMRKVEATLKKYGGSLSDTLDAMKRATAQAAPVTVEPAPADEEAPAEPEHDLQGLPVVGQN